MFGDLLWLLTQARERRPRLREHHELQLDDLSAAGTFPGSPVRDSHLMRCCGRGTICSEIRMSQVSAYEGVGPKGQPPEGPSAAQAVCGSPLSPHVHSPWRGCHVDPATFKHAPVVPSPAPTTSAGAAAFPAIAAVAERVFAAIVPSAADAAAPPPAFLLRFHLCCVSG